MAKKVESKQFRDNKGRFRRLTTDELRKITSEAGKKSVEVRRQQRTFAELCHIVDEMPMRNASLADGLRSIGIDEQTIEKMDQKLAKVFALQRKALQGDPKAIELWLKLTGEYEEKKNINITGAPLSDGVVSFTAADE